MGIQHTVLTYSLTHSSVPSFTHSLIGKDLTAVGKALGLDVVNITVADLEKISDVNVLITPTSVIQSSKGITKPLGVNGKIVVYNDVASSAAANGTCSLMYLLTYLLIHSLACFKVLLMFQLHHKYSKLLQLLVMTIIFGH